MKIRFLIIFAVLLAVFFGYGIVSKAQTVDTSALIAQLQAQIQSLLQQIASIQAQLSAVGSTSTAVPATGWTNEANETNGAYNCHTFNINLGFAQSGNRDILSLKEYLIKDGVMPYQAVDATYDEELATYVSQFQTKYGILRPNGYFGPQTRSKMNALFGCSDATCTRNPDGSCLQSPCVCTSWSDWSSCIDGQQIKSCTSALLSGCGEPSIRRPCTLPTQTIQTTIDRLSTSSAAAGSQVTIYGTNFGASAIAVIYPLSDYNRGVNVCSYNTCISNQSGTSLTFTVPQNTSAGKYDLAVFAQGSPVSSNNVSLTVTTSSISCTPNWQCGEWSACSQGVASAAEKQTLLNTVAALQTQLSQTSDSAQKEMIQIQLRQIQLRLNPQKTRTCTDLNACSIPSTQSRPITSVECQTPVASDVPTITVTSPKYGDLLTIGSQTTIQWIAQNMPTGTTYTVSLYQGMSASSYYPNRIIISGMQGSPVSGGTTSLNWTVSGEGLGLAGKENLLQKLANLITPKVSAAGGYVIQVCGGGVCGTSGVFAMTTGPLIEVPQPIITVTAPNAQDVWKVGETRQIVWQTRNITSPDDKITVYIVPEGDGSKNINIGQGLQNTGSYNYVVEDPSKYSYRSSLYAAGNNFKIFICAQKNGDNNLCSNGMGYSVGSFKIISATQPTITITSPNGGESWKVGETHNITWTSSGMPSGATVSIGINGDGSSSTMAGGQIASNVPVSSGSYQWTVPSFLGENLADKKYGFYVNYTGTSGSFGDNSNGYVSISAATTSAGCTDTDGGKDYFTKGSTTVGSTIGEDHCNGQYLIEYYCEPVTADNRGYDYASYTCPNGCVDGACVRPTSSISSQSGLASISSAIMTILQNFSGLLKK